MFATAIFGQRTMFGLLYYVNPITIPYLRFSLNTLHCIKNILTIKIISAGDSRQECAARVEINEFQNALSTLNLLAFSLTCIFIYIKSLDAIVCYITIDPRRTLIHISVGYDDVIEWVRWVKIGCGFRMSKVSYLRNEP